MSPRNDSVPPERPSHDSPGQAPAPSKVISSRELMADESEISIAHEDIVYRLRKTHTGKLILTK